MKASYHILQALIFQIVLGKEDLLKQGETFWMWQTTLW